MLERLLEQRKTVTFALADATGKNVPPNLMKHEWTSAADLVACLKSFLDVTILMCSTSYPTLLMILPVLDGLTDLLRSTTGGLDGLQFIYIDLLQEKFGDLYADEDLCVATVVDPCFKDILFGTADVKSERSTGR